MRDNELISRLIGDTESFIKSRLVAVIEADASPKTISGFVSCLQTLHSLSCGMGARPSENPEVIYAIAREAVAPVEKKLIELIQLTEGIEKSLEGGDRHD